LEDFLDCYLLFFLGHVEEASSKDDTERAITDYFAVCVLDFPWFSRFAVRRDDLDNPGRVVWGGVKSGQTKKERRSVD